MVKIIEIDTQGTQEIELPEFSLAAILVHRGEDAEKYAEEYIDDTTPEMRVGTHGDTVVVQFFNAEDFHGIDTTIEMNAYVGKMIDWKDE
jgi:hypothetical protein